MARKKKTPVNPEPAATCPPAEDQSFQQLADQFAAQLDSHEEARISQALATLKTEIFPKLKQAGVVKLVADYSGYGDDGCINSLDCFDKQGQPVNLELVGPASDNEIQTLLHEFLPDGFEIGDGGQGDLTVDVAAGTVTLEHQENFTETRDSTSQWEV
jgi:hypothetical protein